MVTTFERSSSTTRYTYYKKGMYAITIYYGFVYILMFIYKDSTAT